MGEQSSCEKELKMKKGVCLADLLTLALMCAVIAANYYYLDSNIWVDISAFLLHWIFFFARRVEEDGG